MDLLIPIISLIICCVIGMLYTGGFFSGVDFVTAFSESNASLGLTLGSFFGLLITLVLYQVRRVLDFHDCMACIPEGFKAMVPAILILTFAWTLKAMTDSLGADVYVADLVYNHARGLLNFLPAIIFLVGCLLAFATGTSWGTFGILIPIVVGVFQNTNPELMIISISACMAGAVCGDHCSPISDTTIMASAGAQCEHVNHVMHPASLCGDLRCRFLCDIHCGRVCKDCLDRPSCGHRPDAWSHVRLKDAGRYGGGKPVKHDRGRKKARRRAYCKALRRAFLFYGGTPRPLPGFQTAFHNIWRTGRSFPADPYGFLVQRSPGRR